MLFPKWEKVNSGENNSKNVSSCETSPALSAFFNLDKLCIR